MPWSNSAARDSALRRRRQVCPAGTGLIDMRPARRMMRVSETVFPPAPLCPHRLRPDGDRVPSWHLASPAGVAGVQRRLAMTQTPFDQLVAALTQARSRRQLAGRAGLLLVGVLRGS